MQTDFFPPLLSYVDRVKETALQLSTERRDVLQPLIDHMTRQIAAGNSLPLVFICTHNSRRSQLAQCWAYCWSWHFQLPQVAAYSGGTEVTAFHPNAIAALERAGWQVQSFGQGNPIRECRFSPSCPPLVAWSKRYDDPTLPPAGFAALMTCSEADEACPVIAGAAVRLPLNYQDPKVGDGTPTQDTLYDERCMQIAAELYHVFHAVSHTPQA